MLFFVNGITIFLIFSFTPPTFISPLSPQLSKIWEMLTISNYYNPTPQQLVFWTSKRRTRLLFIPHTIRILTVGVLQKQ